MTEPGGRLDPSYRALLAVPGFAGLLGSMTLARTGQAMGAMALTLLALQHFGSAPLAGAVAFASIVPGLFVSPVAGALLDRHGRVRLVALDYLVAALALGVVAALGASGLLSPPVLLVVAAIASLTNPLSNTGLRSLFPRVVPVQLWERANAGDSAAWVVSSLAGPPLAGVAVHLVGPSAALGLVAVVFAAAIMSLRHVPDPPAEVASTGRLWRDAADGLVYFWRNPTLRALGAAITLANVTWGSLSILVPVIVLDRLHGDAATVGWVFAVQGLGGLLASLAFGRRNSAGRERRWLASSLVATAFVLLLLLPDAGLAPVIAAMLLIGLLNGPLDIAMFTLRQRCTDPAWIGRAFAVSMSVNWLGAPIGAALAGALAPSGTTAPLLVALATGLAAAACAWWLIPADVRQASPA